MEVEGRSIGVFNVHGRYYALRNRCPHQARAAVPGRDQGHGAAQQAGRVPVGARGRDPALPLARLGVRPDDRPLDLQPAQDARALV
ncbi:MAG: hypothetical protein WKF31_03140 [Thermoleophilaceae bacterium]